MEFTLRTLIGAVAAISIAIAANRARSLSISGAVAAAVIGTAAVAAGWNWGMLLVGYFISSSVLSRLGRARKLAQTKGMVEKTGPRDARQVLSNGLPFGMLAVWWAVNPGGGIGQVMCAAATTLAVSAADTWATEIGTWVGHPPRSVLTGRKLRVGQSGGVTLAGLLGSLGGALFVATMAGFLGWRRNMLPTVIVGGILGAMMDSFLGALIQERRWCDACADSTEMQIHHCGSVTRRTSGFAMVDNDTVNLLATTLGAVLGLLFTPGIPD